MKKKKRKVSDIQSVIMLVLSLMTVTTSIFIGLLLYNRYETAMRHNDVSNTQNMMESMVSSTEQYLKSMRQLANTINYNIIQVYDVSDPEFNQQLSLIYEADKDKIQSIALYDMEGELIAIYTILTAAWNICILIEYAIADFICIRVVNQLSLSVTYIIIMLPALIINPAEQLLNK